MQPLAQSLRESTCSHNVLNQFVSPALVSTEAPLTLENHQLETWIMKHESSVLRCLQLTHQLLSLKAIQPRDCQSKFSPLCLTSLSSPPWAPASLCSLSRVPLNCLRVWQFSIVFNLVKSPSRFRLLGIFLTQGSNPGLPHCRQMLYPLSTAYQAIKPWLRNTKCVYRTPHLDHKYEILCHISQKTFHLPDSTGSNNLLITRLYHILNFAVFSQVRACSCPVLTRVGQY